MDHCRTSRGVVGTGSPERQTLALLWEGGPECQDYILKAMGSQKALQHKVLAELGFEKTNLSMCWQDPQRGWG